jgi:hypothetical protein
MKLSSPGKIRWALLELPGRPKGRRRGKKGAELRFVHRFKDFGAMLVYDGSSVLKLYWTAIPADYDPAEVGRWVQVCMQQIEGQGGQR